MGEEVAVYLVGVGARCLGSGARGGGMLFVFQLADGFQAGAGDALVGGDDDAADAVFALQGADSQHHLYGRAVRVGNDAVVGLHGVDVDFGYHEGDVRVLAPGRRVVDDHGALLGEAWRILARGVGAGREDGVVGAFGDGVVDGGHRQFPPGEGQGVPGRPRRGGGEDLGMAVATLFQYFKHFASHQSGGAYDSYFHRLIVLVSGCKDTKKNANQGPKW